MVSSCHQSGLRVTTEVKKSKQAKIWSLAHKWPQHVDTPTEHRSVCHGVDLYLCVWLPSERTQETCNTCTKIWAGTPGRAQQPDGLTDRLTYRQSQCTLNHGFDPLFKVLRTTVWDIRAVTPLSWRRCLQFVMLSFWRGKLINIEETRVSRLCT